MTTLKRASKKSKRGEVISAIKFTGGSDFIMSMKTASAKDSSMKDQREIGCIKLASLWIQRNGGGGWLSQKEIALKKRKAHLDIQLLSTTGTWRACQPGQTNWSLPSKASPASRRKYGYRGAETHWGSMGTSPESGPTACESGATSQRFCMLSGLEEQGNGACIDFSYKDGTLGFRNKKRGQTNSSLLVLNCLFPLQMHHGVSGKKMKLGQKITFFKMFSSRSPSSDELVGEKRCQSAHLPQWIGIEP